MTTAPTCIIAYTGDDDRYRSVLQAAEETAANAQARLILFDADAASMFNEPLPSDWSGEGSRELFPDDVLSPEDLERAGRHAVAEQVRHARSLGIQAYAWLPSSKDADAIAEYADKAEADLIMLPSELEEPGLLDRLRGKASVEDTAEKTGRPIAVIYEDGNVEYR